MFAAFDPWILSFSAITVLATIWMGYWAAQKARTASDFFVAGRGVSVGWNASAISGEYLSAASFMGIAGMVMSSGYDALWYPVCYACGYLFLLLFIAGPLRRFGAYTIPDFAEGRYDSPVFRKIAVIFVLFIGFFYTMPQMKGAGTTLSYIFQDITWFGQKGLPYWVGVVLVGVVITFNVAVGGMKGITLVQAFQYWLKMFAISVPIFVLMAVYGGYGRQLQEQNPLPPPPPSAPLPARVDAVNDPGRLRRAELHVSEAVFEYATLTGRKIQQPGGEFLHEADLALHGWLSRWKLIPRLEMPSGVLLRFDVPETPAVDLSGNYLKSAPSLGLSPVPSAGTMLGSGKIIYGENPTLYVHETASQRAAKLWHALREVGVDVNPVGDQELRVVWHRSGIPPENRRMDPTVQLLRPPVPTGQIRGQNTSPTEDLRASAANAANAPTSSLRQPLPAKAPPDAAWLNPFGPLTTKAAKAAKLEGEQVKPYALLYTYSLIIALVCGTAGLPHILVRFYTNPDGVAAKRTTMWVMILIGVFYVFPPVFGVMGRNLMPALYEGTGAKGTDKVVLELPKVLDTSAPGAAAGMTGTTPRSSAADRGTLPWGSILSGITCAGAFAAFMSTFSGLLVSMTGALAHDVYGRMLRPQSSAADRMRMFKWCAALIGGVATLLGCFVEPLEINFMVGQAFAIAAASYFPLLFMSVWWRGMTIRGAATGMLVGGICALLAVALTNASNLALDKGPMGQLFSAFAPLNAFWAAHPLLRILCEQPAIWTVPLAILLMILVSRLTASTVPSDIRLKMLVLHAPEKLGLKQDYIREHEGAGH